MFCIYFIIIFYFYCFGPPYTTGLFFMVKNAYFIFKQYWYVCNALPCNRVIDSVPLEAKFLHRIQLFYKYNTIYIYIVQPQIWSHTLKAVMHIRAEQDNVSHWQPQLHIFHCLPPTNSPGWRKQLIFCAAPTNLRAAPNKSHDSLPPEHLPAAQTDRDGEMEAEKRGTWSERDRCVPESC